MSVLRELVAGGLLGLVVIVCINAERARREWRGSERETKPW